MNRCRIGVLGCARIARRSFVPAVRKSVQAEVVGIASRDLARAHTWARELGVAKAYGSYEELLNDADVDAVYLPVPNSLHGPLTIAAARAGKHVLCEKPLALTGQEANAMVAECTGRNRVLMEAFMWRHHPRALHARRLVRDGGLGELRSVEVDLSFKLGLQDWRRQRDQGGGVLMDLGCYAIDAGRFFYESEPSSWRAEVCLSNTLVDTSLRLELRFASGGRATVNCSFERRPTNRIRLIGTRAKLDLPGGILPSERSELIWRKGRAIESTSFDGVDQYACQIDAFAEAVARGQLREPAEDGLANMKTLDAVKRGIECASAGRIGLYSRPPYVRRWAVASS